MILTYSLLSVLLVSLISLAGVILLSLKLERIKLLIFFLVSFAAGTLIGDSFIHLLPEAVEESGFTLQISLAVLLGIIVMFLVEKVIHWHHCHHSEHGNHHVHPFAITNLIGDGVHNFIDGLIIAASYMVSIPVGIATTFAVIMHEIPQEISDFAVLVHGGYSRRKAIFLNFITALTSFLGVVIAFILANQTDKFVFYFIPFAAGVFIYIASADLIPELHKELKVSRSTIQLISFILGIVAMLALLLLE